jgi:hypothetical protein
MFQEVQSPSKFERKTSFKRESMFKIKEDYFIGTLKSQSSKQAVKDFAQSVNEREDTVGSRTYSLDVKN